MKAKPKGKLEVVTWRDAASWVDPPDPMPKDYLVQTVGWVTQRGRFLRVTAEFTPEAARGVTIIPLKMVVHRRSLGG